MYLNSLFIFVFSIPFYYIKLPYYCFLKPYYSYIQTRIMLYSVSINNFKKCGTKIMISQNILFSRKFMQDFHYNKKKSSTSICLIYFLFLAPSIQIYQKIEPENIFIWISSYVRENALEFVIWIICSQEIKIPPIRKLLFSFFRNS